MVRERCRRGRRRSGRAARKTRIRTGSIHAFSGKNPGKPRKIAKSIRPVCGGLIMRRMTHAFPPLTKDLIEAYAASAVAWAVRFLGVLVRPRASRRRSVRGLLKWLERAVE